MNQTQLIINMFNQDISTRKISKTFNIPEIEVFEILKKNNIEIRRDFKRIERDKEICDRFKNGESIIELTKSFKLERHTIAEILDKNLIERRKRNASNLSPEKIERNKKIIELYQQGNSSYQVSKEIGVCVSTVFKVLRDFCINVRPQHQPGHSKGTSKNRKHNFDLKFFETINTEEKAYWLGFLYADGYVSYKGRFKLALQEKDLNHLNKFLKSIKADTIKPKYDKRTKSYGVSIQSVNLTSDLTKLGCFQKKSLTLKFPCTYQVPDSLIHHFMRGYFDGDGCICRCESNNTNTFSILGTPEFLDIYEDILIDHCKDKKKNKRIINKYWNEQTQSISYSSKDKLIDIYNFLYKDATIYLDRKYEKFNDILSRLKTKAQKS